MVKTVHRGLLWSSAVLLFFTVLSTTLHSAVVERRVAVLNFTANNTSEGISRIVRNQVEINLFKTQYFDILERNQIDLLLKEREKQAAECNDEDCAVKIGKILSAHFVIIGSVDKLESFVITIKVVSVEKRSVILVDSQGVDSIRNLRNTTTVITRRVAEKLRVNLSSERESFFPPLSLSFRLSYLWPTGYLEDLAHPGYGVSMRGIIENFFVKDVQLGIGLSYFSFRGRDEVYRAMMIPAVLIIGYRFAVWRFSITPELSSGVSYNTLSYDSGSQKSGERKESRLQPLVKAGVLLSFPLGSSLDGVIGAEYGSIFERDGRISFVIFTTGVSASF